MFNTYDVAVVGGGIIGASTAFQLARSGARVLLLEANTIASGVSDHSFSWLNSGNKHPEAYHRLNAAGLADYALLDELAGVEVYRTGSLHTPILPGEAEQLEGRRQRLNDLGYRARWISRAAAIEMEPNLAVPESSERVLFFEDEAWVDPPQLIRALLAAAGDAVEVREHTPVLAVEHHGGSVTSLQTRSDSVAVGAVVMCVGTGTTALAASLGVHLPVERRPGLLVVTSPVAPGTLSRVIHHAMAPDISCHLRPDVTGGVRIGSDQYDEPMREDTVVAPPPPEAHALLARATEVLPVLQGVGVARAHLGIRPIPADGLSVAGQLPGFDNAFAIVTHSGVTMGPLLGRLIATEVTDRIVDPLLADFRPERFMVTS